VRRYIGFLEVEALPLGTGAEREVELVLPVAERASFRKAARLLLIDDLAVALVRVTRS